MPNNEISQAVIPLAVGITFLFLLATPATNALLQKIARLVQRRFGSRANDIQSCAIVIAFLGMLWGLSEIREIDHLAYKLLEKNHFIERNYVLNKLSDADKKAFKSLVKKAKKNMVHEWVILDNLQAPDREDRLSLSREDAILLKRIKDRSLPADEQIRWDNLMEEVNQYHHKHQGEDFQSYMPGSEESLFGSQEERGLF